MENNFDKHIKDSLENLGDQLSPGSWELLQHKMMLDPELGGANDTFDQNIREKLNEVEANYDPSHWAAMESQLDHMLELADVNDLELDGLVYENLNDLRIPYNHAHWTLMSNRLDEEFSIRRKLYKYKVAEVALMLLALFTLFQYLPLHKKHRAAKQIEQSILPATSAGQLAEASIPQEGTPSVEELADRTVIATEPSVEDSAEKGTIANTTSELNNRTLSQNLSDNLSDSATATEENKDNLSINLLTNKPLQDPLLARQPILLSSLIGHQLFDQEESKFTYSNRWAALNNIVNAKPINPFATDQLTYALPLSSLQMEIPSSDRPIKMACEFCPPSQPVKVRVGMFISTDFNEIMTPEKVYPNFVDAAYQQVTAGYGGGISLGFQHQKWEFETGIAYARVSYEPNKTLITTGSFIRSNIQREVFDAAFLNIVKIPLHFNYTFDQNNKWRFYAIGGASINILALNHFNHSTTAVGGGPPTIAAVPREKAPTYNGILDGGSFGSNSYYTANVGMGVEHNLTSRWSIFMQPIYQHLFYQKGFGPNNDRFNTLSIQIGAKSTFK